MQMDVTLRQLQDYYEGEGAVQQIFPQLTAGEREFIMTGVTPEEFDKTFSNINE